MGACAEGRSLLKLESSGLMGRFGNSKYEQLRVEKLMLLVKTIKDLLKWSQNQKEQNFSAVVRVTG